MTPAILSRPAKRTHFLHAGRMFLSQEPAIVTTILGSCVSVCIWDERLGIGGMNHYLLPQRIAGESASARFGTLATHDLLDTLLGWGATPGTLRAKVFGGATLLAMPAAGPLAIGTRNADVALQILAERRVAVVARSLGGSHGRKIVFHTDDGTTQMRVLRGS